MRGYRGNKGVRENVRVHRGHWGTGETEGYIGH